MLMLDGLRPDAIAPAQAENLIQFQQQSAHTLTAQSVMPTITLPCHMTLFHSIPAARHGIVDNEWRTVARPVRGLFELFRARGKRSAAVYSWETFRELWRPGSLVLSYFEDVCYQPDGDEVMAAIASQYIQRDDLDFMFVYFGSIDLAGHAHGWMTDGYLAQVHAVDALVGQVLDAVPAGSTVLMQADHGGHERTHGTESSQDMNIPWMVAGPGIRANYSIQQPVCLLDTAPTLARILGLDADPDWEGVVIEEIFL